MNNQDVDKPAGKSPAPKNLSGPLLLMLVGLFLLVGILGSYERSGPKPPSAEEGPRLQVDKELVDFGEVKMSVLVETSFTLTNTGSSTLQFTQRPYISAVVGC